MFLTKRYSAKETIVTCHECGATHSFFTVENPPPGFVCTNCQSIFTLDRVDEDGSLMFKLSGYCRIHHD
jgi:hypothetical protein